MVGTGLLSMVHRAKLHKNLSCGLNRRDLNMYPVYHEMDISRFVETINEKWDQVLCGNQFEAASDVIRSVPERAGKEEWCGTSSDPAF